MRGYGVVKTNASFENVQGIVKGRSKTRPNLIRRGRRFLPAFFVNFIFTVKRRGRRETPQGVESRRL